MISRIAYMLLYRFCRYVAFRASQLLLACFYPLRRVFPAVNFIPTPKKQLTARRMPQEVNVLCCYNCSMYQVNIVSKSNKWRCTICGQRQSIKVIYFQGSASDCRKQVQSLNYEKARDEDQESFHSVSIEQFGLDCEAQDGNKVDNCNCATSLKTQASKWDKYMESDKEDSRESVDEKENITCDGEVPRLQILDTSARRSLPPMLNSARMKSESGEWLGKTRSMLGRSQSYPLGDTILKQVNKRDKLLKNEKTAVNSSIEGCRGVQQSLSLKKNIFEDSNDDLDITIDF